MLYVPVSCFLNKYPPPLSIPRQLASTLRGLVWRTRRELCLGLFVLYSHFTWLTISSNPKYHFQNSFIMFLKRPSQEMWVPHARVWQVGARTVSRRRTELGFSFRVVEKGSRHHSPSVCPHHCMMPDTFWSHCLCCVLPNPSIKYKSENYKFNNIFDGTVRI